MSARKTCMLSALWFPLAALMVAAVPSSAAHARLLRLEITARDDYGTFRPGRFVRWEGTATGELQPSEPIPGLDKAQRNARGLVEYKTAITLLMPADPRQGNGVLLIDIPNRGRPYAQALYNSPRDEPFESRGTLLAGNAERLKLLPPVAEPEPGCQHHRRKDQHGDTVLEGAHPGCGWRGRPGNIRKRRCPRRRGRRPKGPCSCV